MRCVPIALLFGLLWAPPSARALAQGPAPAPMRHWAYRPIVRPAVVGPGAPGSPEPIDALVAAALRTQRLAPAPAAAPATWLRRVHLDLTGLPPSVEQVDAFELDPSPAARARIVDALLASEQSAERWTQWWLDLARYADSQGYEKDGLRPGMWRYRDWVLQAFRRGLPFDRFTIEQLAGDLLPAADDEQRLATAFHRQTMCNTEGGTDDEEFRVAAVVDRVDTTMSVWMASTLGCAQCHDHKYDPFAQREFFQLYAFFDQTADADRDDDHPLLAAPTPAQQAEAASLRAERAAIAAAMQVGAAEVDAWLVARQTAAAALRPGAVRPGPWRQLGPMASKDLATAHATEFGPEPHGIVDQPPADQAWRSLAAEDGEVVPLEGRNSAFYLHRQIAVARDVDVVLVVGSDDAVKVWCNGELLLDFGGTRAAAPDQHFLPVTLAAGDNDLLLKVSNGGGGGGFYFDLRSGAHSRSFEQVLRQELIVARERAAAEFQSFAPRLQPQRERLAEVERGLAAVRGPLVPVLQELPPDRRRTTRVHLRGSFLSQGDVVQPDTPRVWPAMAGELPRDRLGLAHWLMANDNPLTARVIANRIWSELFGAGLVTTLEDFGSQGEPPSHPDLLDWLASEFRDSGWSLRHLLRTIVLSATYGRSAVVDVDTRERDPDNRWFARGPAVRLPAETLRDQALAVSGLLSPRFGGPSVMPPQPDGVWMQIYSGERWVPAQGADRHRRALYTFWRRTSPHPAMLMFDAQSREACVLRRQRTNTPLQALVLWNDPQFCEPARALASQLAARGGDDGERVAWLWRRCLLRQPTATERARLLALLVGERRQFAADPAAAKALGGDGADAPEVAAWTVVAGVVLALDEFVTKR